MYTEPPTTFDALVAPWPDPVRDVALWLRGLILAEFPELVETVSGGRKLATALYGVGGPDRVAFGMQPNDRFVKLFIHDPEHLPDSSFRLEGKGKHMRHVKLDFVPSDRRDELLGLLRVPVERRL